MPTDLLLQIGLVVVGLGVVALRWWFQAERVAMRRIAQAAPTEIAAAEEGQLVRITGVVVQEGDATLEAPVSARPCVGYLAQVEQRSGSSSSGHAWKERIRTQELIDFVVEDDTGRALIKGAGAQLVVNRDEHQSSGPMSDPSPRARRLLDEHGVDPEAWHGSNKRLRYREGAIEVGETVTVMGKARREVDPDKTRSAGYRERPKRLVLEAADGEPLVVSDDPKVLSAS